MESLKLRLLVSRAKAVRERAMERSRRPGGQPDGSGHDQDLAETADVIADLADEVYRLVLKEFELAQSGGGDPYR